MPAVDCIRFICSNETGTKKKEVQIDYCGFTVPDMFIVGYGIDYAEHYRNLPYITALKQD